MRTLIGILAWGSPEEADEAAALLMRVGPSAVPYLERELRGLADLQRRDDALAALQGDLFDAMPTDPSPNATERRDRALADLDAKREHLYGSASPAGRIRRAIARCRQMLGWLTSR